MHIRIFVSFSLGDELIRMTVKPMKSQIDIPLKQLYFQIVIVDRGLPVTTWCAAGQFRPRIGFLAINLKR